MPQTPDAHGPSDSGEALAAIARRAAAGDHGAFETLFRRLGPAVRRMLVGRTRGNEHLADDLSQRTWAGLWQSFQTNAYDSSRSAITTYVYAIAYRTWLHSVRQSTSGLERDTVRLGETEPVHLGPDLESSSDLAGAIEAVRGALQGRENDLGDEDRDMLRAIAAGESDRAIAKRLGLAPSTVNARKQTALGKLSRILARKGFRGEDAERGTPGGKQPIDPAAAIAHPGTRPSAKDTP